MNEQSPKAVPSIQMGDVIMVQANAGQPHDLKAIPMPNEVLLVHVEDPQKGLIQRQNAIRETRFGKVLAVGVPTGRYREAPVKVGDIVVMQTATAGVAVGQLCYQNKRVHRIEWRNLVAILEDHGNE